MVITIFGEPESGKTTLARDFTKQKNTAWLAEGLQGLTSPFWTYRFHVNKETDFIVIDNIRESEYLDLVKKFSESKLEIHTPCKKSKIIDMPNVILIIN